MKAWSDSANCKHDDEIIGIIIVNASLNDRIRMCRKLYKLLLYCTKISVGYNADLIQQETCKLFKFTVNGFTQNLFSSNTCIYARAVAESGYLIYSVSQKKSPLRFSDIFFPNGWEFFNQFLHTYYTFLSTLNYKFLFSYLQL